MPLIPEPARSALDEPPGKPAAGTSVRVLGPNERSSVTSRETLVDTTSKATTLWTTDLSPFHLGPCPLYDERVAVKMENAWQFAKVYADQLDEQALPSTAYWQWAEQGWARASATRYPRGKGAKPAYCWWAGKRLGYLEARLQVYWFLYRDAVRKTAGFARLQEMVATGQALALFDFDGYDHEARRMDLSDVLRLDTRPMGHAFVLKAMLLYGVEVTPERLFAADQVPRQLLLI